MPLTPEQDRERKRRIRAAQKGGQGGQVQVDNVKVDNVLTGKSVHPTEVSNSSEETYQEKADRLGHAIVVSAARGEVVLPSPGKRRSWGPPTLSVATGVQATSSYGDTLRSFRGETFG